MSLWRFKKTLNEEYNEEWCKNPISQGKKHPCIYNFIATLEETHQYLINEFGKIEVEWENIHRDSYRH